MAYTLAAYTTLRLVQSWTPIVQCNKYINFKAYSGIAVLAEMVFPVNFRRFSNSSRKSSRRFCKNIPIFAGVKLIERMGRFINIFFGPGGLSMFVTGAPFVQACQANPAFVLLLDGVLDVNGGNEFHRSSPRDSSA